MSAVIYILSYFIPVKMRPLFLPNPCLVIFRGIGGFVMGLPVEVDDEDFTNEDIGVFRFVEGAVLMFAILKGDH